MHIIFFFCYSTPDPLPAPPRGGGRVRLERPPASPSQRSQGVAPSALTGWEGPTDRSFSAEYRLSTDPLGPPNLENRLLGPHPARGSFNRRGAGWERQRLVCLVCVCLMKEISSVPWRINILCECVSLGVSRGMMDEVHCCFVLRI